MTSTHNAKIRLIKVFTSTHIGKRQGKSSVFGGAAYAVDLVRRGFRRNRQKSNDSYVLCASMGSVAPVLWLGN